MFMCVDWWYYFLRWTAIGSSICGQAQLELESMMSMSIIWFRMCDSKRPMFSFCPHLIFSWRLKHHKCHQCLHVNLNTLAHVRLQLDRTVLSEYYSGHNHIIITPLQLQSGVGLQTRHRLGHKTLSACINASTWCGLCGIVGQSYLHVLTFPQNQ